MKKSLTALQKIFLGIAEQASSRKEDNRILDIQTLISVIKKKDTYQNHCIMGNLAYDLKDNRRMGMFLLNNILGGQGLNSRLNFHSGKKTDLPIMWNRAIILISTRDLLDIFWN